jgi:hypothetical protein
MEVYKGVEVELYTLQTSALDEGKFQTPVALLEGKGSRIPNGEEFRWTQGRSGRGGKSP